MTTVDELFEALSAFSVHEGFPDDRRALAGKMLDEGVTVEQIEVIGEHCESMVEGKVNAVRVMISIITDPKKREARLKDLATVAAAKLKRRGQNEAPISRSPSVMQSTPEDDARRLCWMAYIRVFCDRRKPEEVAAEFAVTPEQLAQMLEKGREYYFENKKPMPPATEEEEAETHEERVKRFREMMATKRGDAC